MSVELEAARQKSVGSRPAPKRPTPHGFIPFITARIPSDTFGETPRDLDDFATTPPPPTQQALIDAMSRDAPPKARRAVDVVGSLPVPAPSAKPNAPFSAVAQPSEPSAQEMKDRVALGDYSGALEIAERLLALDSSNETVQICASSCRGVLRQMYTTRIGALDRVPVVMVARDQLRWLSIDHRAGFVLSLVDGVSSAEMILDVSGMPQLDTLRILSELSQQRIISFR